MKRDIPALSAFIGVYRRLLLLPEVNLHRTMDDLTHLAIAGTLGYALRSRGMTPRAIGVMAVAAIAPDIEGVIGWFSPSVYLTYYHGPAHSLLGAVILGALVAFIAKRY